MYCKFCRLPTAYFHLPTERLYCSDACLSSYTTYVEWKTKNTEFLTASKAKEVVLNNTPTETFHEIVMRTGAYPIVAAHRGGGFDFGPENTLPAFNKSVECGARLLELDLRLTKDNVLVLLHWSTVDECTNGSGAVSSFTLEELRKLDAAYRHPTLKGTGVCIPTFKEFLDEFVPVKDLLFFFDFKESLTLRMALKFIEPYHIEGRFCIGSVVSETNALILRLRDSPNVPVCVDIQETLRVLGAYYLGLLDRHKLVHDIYGFVLCKATLPFWSRGFVEAIHKQGRRVVVSGYGDEMNKRHRLIECLEYGVDIIMVDDPGLMREIMQETQRGSWVSEDEKQDWEEEEEGFI